MTCGNDLELNPADRTEWALYTRGLLGGASGQSDGWAGGWTGGAGKESMAGRATDDAAPDEGVEAVWQIIRDEVAEQAAREKSLADFYQSMVLGRETLQEPAEPRGLLRLPGADVHVREGDDPVRGVRHGYADSWRRICVA